MLKYTIDFNGYEEFVERETCALFTILAAAICREERLMGSFETSLTFVDDLKIQELNFKYRGKNTKTDVLSFPQMERTEIRETRGCEAGRPKLLGDIVVSLPTAIEQATTYGHSLKRELLFLICHSILHLLGYDHMTEEERIIMEHKQKRIMYMIGVSRSGESI